MRKRASRAPALLLLPVGVALAACFGPASSDLSGSFVQAWCRSCPDGGAAASSCPPDYPHDCASEAKNGYCCPAGWVCCSSNAYCVPQAGGDCATAGPPSGSSGASSGVSSSGGGGGGSVPGTPGTPTGPMAGTVAGCGGSGQCTCVDQTDSSYAFCGYCAPTNNCSYCPSGAYCPADSCAAGERCSPQPISCPSNYLPCSASLCCPFDHPVCCSDGRSCATSSTACP